jgi:aconitate hydratase 2/2-methylisocitrate dehydratase
VDALHFFAYSSRTAIKIDSMAPEIYKYINFDKMDEYVESAQRGQEIAVKLIA